MAIGMIDSQGAKQLKSLPQKAYVDSPPKACPEPIEGAQNDMAYARVSDCATPRSPGSSTDPDRPALSGRNRYHTLHVRPMSHEPPTETPKGQATLSLQKQRSTASEVHHPGFPLAWE